jgi:hypothetical protein
MGLRRRGKLSGLAWRKRVLTASTTAPQSNIQFTTAADPGPQQVEEYRWLADALSEVPDSRNHRFAFHIHLGV